MGLYEEADKSSAYLVRSVNNQYAGFSRLTPDYMNTTAAGVISKGPRCEGQAVWKAAKLLLAPRLTSHRLARQRGHPCPQRQPGT